MFAKLTAAIVAVILAAVAAVQPEPQAGGGYPAPVAEVGDAPQPATATPVALPTAGSTPTHLIPTLNAMWTVTAAARLTPPTPAGYPAP